MPNIEGINIQQSSAERKSYVVVGAILSCSSGSKQSRLKMPFSHGVFVKGKPQMNIMDFVPNVNIMPFGKCSSLQNPTVASATAVNNGVLKPMPCTPLTTMPWIDGKADKMVGGHPALLNKSTNMCFYCGQIKIEDDGQDLGGVTVGNQSSTNSGPSAAGFGQGPACEKPQEKPSMWDNFVKGISMLGDVPAAMQKAASELPWALEKAANDLPKGLQKAAEDLPKAVGAFVREGFIEPIQEDLDTLRDDKVGFADGIAIGGLALGVLTLGRSKNVKNLVDAARKGKKRTSVGLTRSTGDSTSSMNPAKFDRMKKAFEKQGGIIDQSEEAIRYLDYRGAEAVTWNEKTIQLRQNPTTSAVFEEFIHTAQYRAGKIPDQTPRTVLTVEIEAAEKLIKYRKAYGIPNIETRDTINRLRDLRQQFDELGN
ncbi:hypothetical protein BFO01nite_32050 [Brevibacillus formosus]|uniref:Tox-PAAR-like domain-containing protein n=1 Tax=Brevibacillus formosus TaxID=54913 RepID=A0ABQ0T6Y0_9BACL|nr:hypothetical protein BFO01nite_32050 [Brevibacillus formosus]